MAETPNVAIMPGGTIEAWFKPRGDQDHKPIQHALYVAIDCNTGDIVGSTAPLHTADFAVLHAAARAYFNSTKE